MVLRRGTMEGRGITGGAFMDRTTRWWRGGCRGRWSSKALRLSDPEAVRAVPRNSVVHVAPRRSAVHAAPRSFAVPAVPHPVFWNSVFWE